MNIDPSVLEVLSTFQQKAPSYIVGGYLRDLICGIKPIDVDIATEMNISEVKELFPQLSTTEKGFDAGIGRFQYHGIPFEISTYTDKTFIDSLKERDFTINSIYHDGKELFISKEAKNDIQNKKITSLANPFTNFIEKPQTYIRAIRISSHLGFTIDENLLNFLKDNKHIFHLNTENRIQNEGYRILSSDYPLFAFYYLQEIGFLKKYASFDFILTIPNLTNDIHYKTAYIAHLIGKDTLFDFIDLFQLSHHMKEKVELLLPYFTDEKTPHNPKTLNEALIIKRYQFQNDKELIKKYMINLKK